MADSAHWTGDVASARWDIYRGDAKAVLEKLPDKSFNCAVTSPPYYWLRDYGVSGQIGHEDTVTEYVDSLLSVMDHVHRLLRDDGLLFLNIGDTYYSGKGMSHGVDRKSKKRRFGLRAVDKSGGVGVGVRPKSLIGIPWRVGLEMQRKWVLRSSIVWHRRSGLITEPVRDRPRHSYEYIFMFAKQRRYYFNQRDFMTNSGGDTVWDDVWTVKARPRSSNGLNTAPFPDELVQRCLDIGCPPDGLVLDPFAGSGTTVRVAVASGRPAVGIDLNREFCNHMVAELRKMMVPCSYASK